jgi:uncharacterized protein YjiS (DUF1127 family)
MIITTSAISVVIKSIGKLIEERRTRSRTVSELNLLSDRELRDIGLSRSDILSVSSQSFAASGR